MAKRIYVGNLPRSADEPGLRALFAQYGEISDVLIVTDRGTGQPKGFAFVEMPDNAASEQAISQLNGSDMGGCALVVNEARERTPSRRG
ncbi:MAG: RNA-binding protein [Armatimonadetes bacterium]|nr:RNA-binding protein [Armatimonadota bacterium]